MTIKFVSYNVLSSHLANAKEYPTCDPAALCAEARFPKLLQHLKPHTQAGAIICLQEISLNWAGKLYAFFGSCGYTMLLNNYNGRRGTGYMGIALAYPIQSFELQRVEMIKIGDLLQAHHRAQAVCVSSDDESSGEPRFEYWRKARSAANVLIYAQLRPVGQETAVAVATYHVPCAYGSPEQHAIVVIHAGLVTQQLQSLAAEAATANGGKPLPCVLCGDFNLQPSDPAYELLTRSTLDAGSPSFPKPSSGYNWVPKLQMPMRSAYAEHVGREPHFTNRVQLPAKGDLGAAAKHLEPYIAKCKLEGSRAEHDFKEERAQLMETRFLDPVFEACLDYIFVCGDISVAEVHHLPAEPPAGAFDVFPTAAEPSDHLLIGATLRFGCSANGVAAGTLESGTPTDDNAKKRRVCQE